MNDSTTSTGGGGPPREPSEEEVRAALEAEMKRIKVDDIVLQTVVSLINLGGRRAGLAPGTEEERDLDQVHTAIEAVRALLPLLERDPEVAKELGPIRDAVWPRRVACARLWGGGDRAEPGGGAEPDDQPGSAPARSSGRLWTPGQ